MILIIETQKLLLELANKQEKQQAINFLPITKYASELPVN